MERSGLIGELSAQLGDPVKLSLRLLLIIFTLLISAPLRANPFRTRFVCMPRVVADELVLEFRIRDRGQCAETETYLEVRPQNDGSTLLLPAGDALTPEEQRDLENYRRFFGGSTPPGAKD